MEYEDKIPKEEVLFIIRNSLGAKKVFVQTASQQVSKDVKEIQSLRKGYGNRPIPTIFMGIFQKTG